MNPSRLLVLLALLLVAILATAAESWADTELAVTNGLQLWLNASRPVEGSRRSTASSTVGKTQPATAAT